MLQGVGVKAHNVLIWSTNGNPYSIRLGIPAVSLVDNSSDEETCTRLNKTTTTIIFIILQQNSPVRHGVAVKVFSQRGNPYHRNPESKRKMFVALRASFFSIKASWFCKTLQILLFCKTIICISRRYRRFPQYILFVIVHAQHIAKFINDFYEI